MTSSAEADLGVIKYGFGPAMPGLGLGISYGLANMTDESGNDRDKAEC